MNKKRTLLLITLSLIIPILLFSGCSGNSDISPIIPDVTDTPVVSDARDSSMSLQAEAILSTVFLGTAIDPQTGELVEGYAILHPRSAKKNPGGGKPAPLTCYGFLASGAKWNTVEPWIINTANNSGLASSYVFNNTADNIAKWEDAADGILGNGISLDILGNGSITTDTLLADEYSPDGLNEVYFGNVSGTGAIAVTIIWGVFGGRPSGRKLLEWDMIFDHVDYDWSSDGVAGKMDFENICTHELGHSAGLDDLYTDACSNETMYGYADYGETNKRTLEAGDIEGINSLYM